jgi:integrase
MNQTSSSKKSKAIHRLSALDVTRSKPGMHHDGGGLYLQVRAAKDDPQRVTRSWLFRYNNRWMGLGSAGPESVDARKAAITLKNARKKAAKLREQTSDGIDPIDARRADRVARAAEDQKAAAQATTFKQCFEGYVTDRLAGQTLDYVAEWKASIERHALPVLGDLPVAVIDTALVMKVLRPIWQEKTPTAAMVRRRIEAILDWAKAMKFREGDNPARWRGHLKHLLRSPSELHTTEHYEALPYVDIPAFIQKLRKQTGTAALALEWLILTCTRSAEGRGARWSEVDPVMWTVPASRMKGRKKEHRVPLSKAATAVLDRADKLRRVYRDNLVFPGGLNGKKGNPISDTSIKRLLREIGYGHLTLHGFRSAFRDWAAECTPFERNVCEMALAHEIENKVEAAYRRGDLFEKRRKLMQAWADYCARPAAPAKVLEFSKKRSAVPRHAS